MKIILDTTVSWDMNKRIFWKPLIQLGKGYFGMIWLLWCLTIDRES